MSAPVDVLAVMERLEDYYRRHEVLIGPVDDAYSVEHKAARLAVAELIAASRDAAAVLQDKAAPMEQETPRRLFAALARVGGAS